MAEGCIAVIDDDPPQVALLTTVLEDEGYHVIAHADIGAAADFIRQERPALALLDLLQGRRLVGLEVVRELRADPTTRNLPIVIVSADAFALRDSAAELNTLGVTAVAKPYSIETLLSTIRGSLELRRQYDPATRR